MHPPQSSTTKRELLRSQIRHRQVTQLFSQHRKKHEYPSTQPHHPPLTDNLQLMNKSLQPDQLLKELPYLLPAIRGKICSNPSVQNIQFVVALCSNILQDSITIDEKQFIYLLCMETIGVHKLMNISAIIQVNLYNAIIGTCFSSLDESKQIQIQNVIIPRLLQLLNLQSIDLSRTTPHYTNQQCIEEVYEGCLSALLNYYEPERDHNMILMYKTKRTNNVISFLVNWWISQKESIQRCTNYVVIMETFNAIFGNISQIPMEFYESTHHHNMWNNLINGFIQQLSIQNEKLTYAKTIALRVLINLLGVQASLLQNIIQPLTITLLMHQLQCSISNDYTIELLTLFTNIVAGLKNDNTVIDEQIGNLLSLIKDILEKQPQQIQQKMMMKCLILIRNILIRGFELGNSEYRNILSSIGVVTLLDELYVTTKDMEMYEVVDSIYYFVDLC